MKRVLVIALLSSMALTNVRAMDKLGTLAKNKTMLEACMKMCATAAVCLSAEKMMCKEGSSCPMKRSATDSSTLVSEIVSKVADGSLQALLQRVFQPLKVIGHNYENDWQSAAVDSVLNAVALEAYTRSGISASYPKVKDFVESSAGKLAAVSLLGVAARTGFTYLQSKVAPAAAVPTK